tara:strand:- start:629 stop:1405 length:777 start_codon:yes stop_codon:yes gene_type:complete
MGVSTISLGLGLGGGKSATSSGRPGGGGALENDFSLNFDGTDDYLDIGTVSELNGSISAVTLSAWFNFSGTYHADKNLVLSGGSSGSDRFYFQQLSATQLRYGSSSGFVDFTIPTVSASTWYHLSLVHNGTSALAYFNGSPSSSNPQTVTAPTANYGTALKVGAYYTGSAVFGGLLDEVSVFDSALSAGDIEDIYNDGVPNDLGTDGLNLSPVAWWRMGDGGTWDGTNWTIPDASTNSNTGTTVNMAEASRVTDVPPT